MKYFARWVGMCFATWIYAQVDEVSFARGADAIYWVGVTLLMCWWFDERKRPGESNEV